MTQHFDPPGGLYVFMHNSKRGRKWLTTTRRHIYIRGMIHVAIPKGFNYDGGSIPWMFVWLVALIDHNHRRERAFLYHDFGYRLQNNSKTTIDSLMYSILQHDFARWQLPLAYLLWLAVRFGGRSSWKKNTEQVEAERKEVRQLLKMDTA